MQVLLHKLGIWLSNFLFSRRWTVRTVDRQNEMFLTRKFVAIPDETGYLVSFKLYASRFVKVNGRAWVMPSAPSTFAGHTDLGHMDRSTFDAWYRQQVLEGYATRC